MDQIIRAAGNPPFPPLEKGGKEATSKYPPALARTKKTSSKYPPFVMGAEGTTPQVPPFLKGGLGGILWQWPSGISGVFSAPEDEWCHHERLRDRAGDMRLRSSR